MGQRGPLPKTTARKRLEGNPGHRPLPNDEPDPRLLSSVPSPPSWLPPIACNAWHVIAEELYAAKMLARLDLHVLEICCVAYAQWREMLIAIDREGYTYRTFNDEGDLKFAAQTPEATLASKFSADFNRWAKVLGLGPAYRVGLRVGETGSKTETYDPIAAMLAGGTGPINAPPKVARKKATKNTVKRKKTAAKKATQKKAAKKKATKPKAGK